MQLYNSWKIEGGVIHIHKLDKGLILTTKRWVKVISTLFNPSRHYIKALPRQLWGYLKRIIEIKKSKICAVKLKETSYHWLLTVDFGKSTNFKWIFIFCQWKYLLTVNRKVCVPGAFHLGQGTRLYTIRLELDESNNMIGE